MSGKHVMRVAAGQLAARHLNDSLRYEDSEPDLETNGAGDKTSTKR